MKSAIAFTAITGTLLKLDGVLYQMYNTSNSLRNYSWPVSLPPKPAITSPNS